nr:hypothetical protein [Tanacetum cinerariifolium]
MEHSNPTLAKIPILDTVKFEQWKFRIQQYLQNEHYALWEKRRNDVKARTTLLLALPDKHQLRFNKYKTAQELWATILKTFGGNEASRKTKKNQLKQQYGNFKAEGKETLEQTFNRLQAIVSHLEFMDIEIEQDDLNQKLLTSLAPEWLMHTIVWRNRSDLDMMSLDDLYNHLKVYKLEVQKKLDSHNMAFISSAKTSSGKEEVNTASFSTASTQVSPASANVAAASISLDTACTYIASQSNDSRRRLGKRSLYKVLMWLALISQRWGALTATRWATLLGSVGFPGAKTGVEEKTTDKSYMENKEENHALVTDEEAPTEFSLMARSSSDNEVEARLVEFKNQEIKFREKIRGLEFKVESKTNRIKSLTNELEMLKKEKEGLDSKLTDNTITDYIRPSPSIESNSNNLQNNSSSVSENEESTSSILSKPEIKFVKAADGRTGNSQNNIDDKGYWDSGCSRHMTGNISYLSDYEPYDGGYVSFGQGGCKITNKETIKTDESMLWHKRLGHLNFKTVNRLVRHNLVKGLPYKCFDNDHTCVACLKEKQHKASCKTKLVNSVSKPLHTLHMDLFGHTNDETSGILKNFITEIENLKELKAEAVNTACYVQNRVLVNMSQNKTPYKLFNGRTPAIGFLKPFGCHVILNTLDHLGKFEAKRDEGYFIGYSMSSKAFRVFNKRTKRVKENMHVDFLKNKLIEKGVGLNWLFDIDTLTNSMNYVPVVSAGTTFTNFSGTKEAASQDVKKDVSFLRYITLPNWFHEAHLETFTSNAQDACKADALESSRNFNPTATSTNPPADQMETLTVETLIPTVIFQMDVKSTFLYGNIDEEVYVMQPFGFQDPEFPARVYRVEKAMYGLHQAPRIWHQVTPKKCHLHAVKRIFIYLKSYPKLRIWYPKDSSFDLVAYLDSDYGGATQDRKSTTGGCQFLGTRLISWQCKKQTIVATSTTKAEYVAAASGCGQVLWIQNQLLDYGHHFIRDCFEKKLISVDHIHTDDNVADLLTKPFDAGRFQYLVVEQAMRGSGKGNHIIYTTFTDPTEELVNALTSLDAACILTSGVEVSVPPAAEVATISVPTGSGMVPTASLIFTTASVVTPYSRRKGKKDGTIRYTKEEEIARDAEITRIHVEEELQMLIDGLDRNNETVAKYLQEYEQFTVDLSIGERIKLINDLVKYQDNYGMSLEEIREKFIPVWEQIEDFVPIGSKEERERFKRKGIRLEQDSAKKAKTSEEVSEEDLKTMMQLVPVEEVEDLNQLWTLVRETLSIRQATSDKEKELWVELKRLYEPDVEDQLWTHTQALMHDPVE